MNAATRQLETSDLRSAIDEFQEAIVLIVGHKIKIPMDSTDDGGAYRSLYVHLGDERRVYLEGCCAGIFSALTKMEKYAEVSMTLCHPVSSHSCSWCLLVPHLLQHVRRMSCSGGHSWR